MKNIGKIVLDEKQQKQLTLFHYKVRELKTKLYEQGYSAGESQQKVNSIVTHVLKMPIKENNARKLLKMLLKQKNLDNMLYDLMEAFDQFCTRVNILTEQHVSELQLKLESSNQRGVSKKINQNSTRWRDIQTEGGNELKKMRLSMNMNRKHCSSIDEIICSPIPRTAQSLIQKYESRYEKMTKTREIYQQLLQKKMAPQRRLKFEQVMLS